jgi:hypothetical protein
LSGKPACDATTAADDDAVSVVNEILKNACGGRSYHERFHTSKITAGKDE